MVQMTTEKDQAVVDLQNVEAAFADVHRKYERTKQVVDGFKKNEEGQIIKDRFFCKYCNMSLKYLNSPSNLMNHVKEKHRDINQNDVNKQPKISSYISINSSSKYKPGNPKQKE